MDREHVKGAAEKAKGAVKDTVGKMTGDTKMRAEGKMDKAKGAAHNVAGDTPPETQRTMISRNCFTPMGRLSGRPFIVFCCLYSHGHPRAPPSSGMQMPHTQALSPPRSQTFLVFPLPNHQVWIARF